MLKANEFNAIAESSFSLVRRIPPPRTCKGRSKNSLRKISLGLVLALFAMTLEACSGGGGGNGGSTGGSGGNTTAAALYSYGIGSGSYQTSPGTINAVSLDSSGSVIATQSNGMVRATWGGIPASGMTVLFRGCFCRIPE